MFHAEDLDRARPAGREIARAARETLERDGAPVALLSRCVGEHRDGTNLAGLVKLYLPMPYGDWGLILLGAGGREDPHLSRSRSASATQSDAPASTTSPTTAGTASGPPECAEQALRL